jgi:hypothetical protein
MHALAETALVSKSGPCRCPFRERELPSLGHPETAAGGAPSLAALASAPHIS